MAMARKALVAVLFLGLAPVLLARQQGPVTVKVQTDTEKDAAGVLGAFKARIGASSRYTLTDGVVAEIFVTVECLALRNEGGVYTGYACSMNVEMMPPDLGGLTEDLGNDLVVCGLDRVEDCGEPLFESFVNLTQADKLSTTRNFLHTIADSYAQYHWLPAHPQKK